MATISENLQIIADSTAAIRQSIIDKGGDASGDIATWADVIGGCVVCQNTLASVSDVKFYDYDGTILYSYTKEQFLELSSMPELPTREGLICQGWNWVLDKSKEYVADYGMLNIGAMYITDDGDTRLYIHIATEGRMTVPLRWSQTVANGVSIDWGDGSDIQSFTGTGNKNTTHKYSNPGDYVIRLKVVDGCTLGLGNSNSSSYCVMGSSSNNGRVYCNMLQAVEIGKNVTSIGLSTFNCCYSLSSVSIPISVTSIGTSAFNSCISLASVSMPSSVTSIGDNAFSSCCSLLSFSMPNSVISIGTYAFSNCYSLSSVSISSLVTSIGTSLKGHAFSNCYSLSSVSMPNSVISIGTYAFSNCYSLSSVSMPSLVTSIGTYAFSSCYSLSSVSIPNSVTSIDTSVFSYCTGVAIYDFTSHTSVPTMSNTNAFSNIPSDCVIKVPASLLEEWKAATNWSTYASKIVAG